MSIWYDKYVQQLEMDLASGEISVAEFEEELLELDYDLQQYLLENIKRKTKGEPSYD